MPENCHKVPFFNNDQNRSKDMSLGSLVCKYDKNILKGSVLYSQSEVST